MMKHFLYINLIGIFWFSANVHADATGKDLLENCNIVLAITENKKIKRESDFVKAGMCIGLITGINDMNTLLKVGGNNPFYCSPHKEDNFEHIKAVVGYLNDHKNELNQIQTGLVLKALMKSFPCSK